MPSFQGQPVSRPASGAGAGRGDNPHGSTTTPQWQTDQHAVAHADGFIGPRISETYGDGRQPTVDSPASGHITHTTNANPGNRNMGTPDRMAHLDNVVPDQNPRMLQHQKTGAIIETFDRENGPKVNDWGTAANGRSMQPHRDRAQSYGRTPIDPTSDDYTDITDTVRSMPTYKEGRWNR